METISRFYEEFTQELRDLNDQYKLLYIAEMQPTPFPMRQAADGNDKYYQQLLDEYPAFFDQVLEEHPTQYATTT